MFMKNSSIYGLGNVKIDGAFISEFVKNEQSEADPGKLLSIQKNRSAIQFFK